MSPLYVILALIVCERLAELAIAARNTKRLLAAGAVEHGRGHYPLFIALHAAWLGTILLAVAPDQPVVWPLIWLYGLLILARVWVMASLGRRWTTRIVILPGAPLVRHGPYRLLRHPNYAIVVAEIAVLPLAFGAWRTALVFSLLNLLLTSYRIHVEDAALAEHTRS
ncbi:MAG TPA: isoprenylcysteine carboxylmethyltransferase family protein [Alphaproteobacteria bacterium]|nr:isoprenylcysteine carboxylmethyltransferase family protein [Alphaproteobacteria bacterium]